MEDQKRSFAGNMIELLYREFPGDFNYLAEETEAGEIDTFMEERLFTPSQKVSRSSLWGAESKRVSGIGCRLGWVPDRFPLIFFSESAGREIADSMAAKQNRAAGGEEEMEKAVALLKLAGMEYLRERQPYQLSDGEMKIVWFLCQLAKQPDFLIIGNLPSGLSPDRVTHLLNLLKDPERIFSAAGFDSPKFILGCGSEGAVWYEELLAQKRWKKIQNRLLINEKS